MEGSTFDALTVDQYNGRLGGTPDWRTNLYSYSCAEMMSLKDQIKQADALGRNFTTEAKTPEIPMPFQGDYTQEDFISQVAETFIELEIDPSRVWLQSFLIDDVYYWLENYPEFGKQAVYLDQRADESAEAYEAAVASLQDIADSGINIVAPSTWQLVTVDNATQTIVPSSYANAANAAGLEIIAWTFERSGPLQNGGGYYYSSVSELINNDGDQFVVMDVIARQVGVSKMFGDWPATLTYYANCFGIK